MNQPGYKQCKVCPFRDKLKSTLHNENGKTVNPMNKPFCTLVNDWVDELTDCEGLSQIETKSYELKCNATHVRDIVDEKGQPTYDKYGNKLTEEYICGKTLAYFSVKVGEKGSIMGLMNLRYTPWLMAYRPRHDGLMGFECICGGTDTRLAKEEKEAKPEEYPDHIKVSEFNQAKFNEEVSTLLALEVSKEG